MFFKESDLWDAARFLNINNSVKNMLIKSYNL